MAKKKATTAKAGVYNPKTRCPLCEKPPTPGLSAFCRMPEGTEPYPNPPQEYQRIHHGTWHCMAGNHDLSGYRDCADCGRLFEMSKTPDATRCGGEVCAHLEGTGGEDDTDACPYCDGPVVLNTIWDKWTCLNPDCQGLDDAEYMRCPECNALMEAFGECDNCDYVDGEQEDED